MIVVVEKGPRDFAVLTDDVGGDEGEGVGAGVASVVGLKVEFFAVELLDIRSEFEE